MRNSMPPRPRLKKYRDLPENLTYDSTCGLYRYHNPITKRRTYLSNNKAASVKAAKHLNLRLMPADGDLVSRVLGGGQTWTMLVYRYEIDITPGEDWSDKTRSQYMSYLRNLKQCALGAMNMTDIEVVHVVAALDKLTFGARMRNVYRHLMTKIFQYGNELGWCHDNPAATTRRANEKRQRMRLDMAGYQAIYDKAEPWLRVAMSLCLVTLQRPEDLVVARYSDIKDGHLHIRQQKTGTKLRIAVGPELQDVIDASRDGKLCPFILHRKPERTRASKLKTHPMQLSVDQIGKAFAAVRDECPRYAKADKPPPFYETKSLGGDRYRAMGWLEADIQALYGHKDKETTDSYLAGHEAPWEDATSG